MEQRFFYKSYFVFCVLMRPAISFLKSKNFQVFVKKKFRLLYPDRGIVPRLGYIPRSEPFSSLFVILATLDKGVSNLSYHYKSFNSAVRDFMQVCICIVTWFPQIMTYLFQGLFKDFWGSFSRSFQGLFFQTSICEKNDQQWTFQIRHTFGVCQKNGGGVGGFGYVFLTFLDDLLYYGYNTASNNPAWKGGLGSSPRKISLKLVQNPAILDNSGGNTSLVIMP